MEGKRSLLTLDINLIMCHVGHFLRMNDYLMLSLACKDLSDQLRFQQDVQDEQLLYISGNVNQIFFRQTGVLFFGSEEWDTTFGIKLSEDSVSLLGIEEFRLLNSPCPFDLDTSKKVKDTHALIFVPHIVSGNKKVNMELLSALCPSIVQDPDPAAWGGYVEDVLLAEEQPLGVQIPDEQPGVPGYQRSVPHFGKWNFVSCGQAKDIAIDQSGWLLFYVGKDGLIPESRGLAFTDSVDLLRKVNRTIDPDSKLGRNGELLAGTGYEILGSLEVAIAASMIFSKTSMRILPAEPERTFAITKYIGKGYNRIIIGENNPSTGLFGWYRSPNDSEVGICSARKLVEKKRGF
mmetsp:Transcript_69360/g.144650  ORF Transcript_69360/g.144650 Transcript_69360/m.144650 type:complete len:348 (-) Transcript_69360:125-1168(-)|eukprot:CAMPEP_0181324412 /NCGR_PEP_ID=MMETSP1101-20121128/20344_1 /TAXON_ID=46948 /ORGANISM="Rhodomonas abbreviata, Strain Caron Lab Isolate" /LENGTH=347 /DNA_ID=CAMNT_0023432583 /DNA_START=155 /DNA_END=1198 /DNA_ORIENTATION=+